MNTGVYRIRNTVNGKAYVGSASRSFKERWGSHRRQLRYGTRHSKHLQNAWNKYGESVFEFEVLERCIPSQCVNCEQLWIDNLSSASRKYGYNSSPTAGSNLGHRFTMAEDAKAKIAQAIKKVWKSDGYRERLSAKISATLTGRKTGVGIRGGWKLNETTRKKMSAYRMGMKRSLESVAKTAAGLRGRKLSDDHRAKLSVSHMGQKPTAATLAKRSESLRLAWAKREAAQSQDDSKLRLSVRGEKRKRL